MNTRKITLLFTLMISLQLTFAQSKVTKEVATAVSLLTKAMIEADSVLLDKITNDSLSYGHSGGTIEGKKSFMDKLISGKSDFVTIDVTDQTIYVSGKTAIVRHNLNAKTNDKGVSGEVHLKVLLVWQKEKGIWKLLARQAVKLI